MRLSEGRSRASPRAAIRCGGLIFRLRNPCEDSCLRTKSKISMEPIGRLGSMYIFHNIPYANRGVWVTSSRAPPAAGAACRAPTLYSSRTVQIAARLHLARFILSDTKCRPWHRDSHAGVQQSRPSSCPYPPPTSQPVARSASGEAGAPLFVPLVAGEAFGGRDGSWPPYRRRFGSRSSQRRSSRRSRWQT